jgi:hypothetical protein
MAAWHCVAFAGSDSLSAASASGLGMLPDYAIVASVPPSSVLQVQGPCRASSSCAGTSNIQPPGDSDAGPIEARGSLPVPRSRAPAWPVSPEYVCTPGKGRRAAASAPQSRPASGATVAPLRAVNARGAAEGGNTAAGRDLTQPSSESGRSFGLSLSLRTSRFCTFENDSDSLETPGPLNGPQLASTRRGALRAQVVMPLRGPASKLRSKLTKCLWRAQTKRLAC